MDDDSSGSSVTVPFLRHDDAKEATSEPLRPIIHRFLVEDDDDDEDDNDDDDDDMPPLEAITHGNPVSLHTSVALSSILSLLHESASAAESMSLPSTVTVSRARMLPMFWHACSQDFCPGCTLTREMGVDMG
jgi:hypothetical protein